MAASSGSLMIGALERFRAGSSRRAAGMVCCGARSKTRDRGRLRMTDGPIWQWSAVETARSIREQRVSAEAVAAAHVARLRQANPALNAVVVDLTESALAAARAADR